MATRLSVVSLGPTEVVSDSTSPFKLDNCSTFLFLGKWDPLVTLLLEPHNVEQMR